MRRENLLIRCMLYLIIFLCIFPVIILITMGFAKSWPWPILYPREFSLRGLKYVLFSKQNSTWILLYSVILSTIVTVLTLIVSIPAAKAIGIYNFKGKSIIKLIILSPIIIPPVSVGLGIHIAFIKVGLANTILGVIVIHLIPCIPYAVMILSDIFEIMGDNMEQQARVLGANRIKCFIYITLPLLMPAIISSAFLVFIVSFSQYFLTFLIGGGQVITYSLVMFPFIQSGDRTIAASYSIIFIITSLIFLIIVNKTVKSYYKLENVFYL